MDVYFETEAQDRLKRIENGEDIETICNEIIYEPYANKEILIYMISILTEKLKHFTSDNEYVSPRLNNTYCCSAQPSKK